MVKLVVVVGKPENPGWLSQTCILVNPGSTMILVGTVSSPKQTLKWLVVCNRLEFLSVKILVELLEAKYNRSSPLIQLGMVSFCRTQGPQGVRYWPLFHRRCGTILPPVRKVRRHKKIQVLCWGHNGLRDLRNLITCPINLV